MISPELEYEIDTLESNRNTVMRIQVPKGKNRPYAIDEYKIYVRDDNETNLAVRDEIVSLVRQGMEIGDVPAPVGVTTKSAAPQPTTSEPTPKKTSTQTQSTETATAVASKPAKKEKDGSDNGKLHPATKNHANPPKPYKPPEVGSVGATMDDNDGIPRAGVEIVGTEHRNGTNYHIMRDLRNGNIVHNVTRESARRLWHYAIRQLETNPVTADSVQWDDEGDIGLWRSYKRGNDVRYDLVKREKNGKLRVFYGVSEAGMGGRWQQFLEPDDD